MAEMDLEWIERVGGEMAEEDWRHCPPDKRLLPHAAFVHGHGAGLLGGFRAGMGVVATLLDDPELDAVPRSVIAAMARDMIGQIEDRYITKVPA